MSRVEYLIKKNDELKVLQKDAENVLQFIKDRRSSVNCELEQITNQ
jgi:hypothetical protein